ncbi:MAG TPA: DivIVA domain-containing protein [Cyclobacteriaceae bacterium]|nr:DivIVA domain-containing protein [Cyclobacteriaceae bacterium]
MKITPLDIRQKTFEKNFRGYDKDEVNAFLLSLSQEWERLMDEGKEMRIKLEAAEREIVKLREVENSLFKTLKTAEDTGANLIEQAHKAAELHLKETQINAEGMLNEARTKAKDTMEEAEMRAKEILDEMEDRLKQLTQQYKSLQSLRDDVMAEVKRFANETLEKAERIAKNKEDFDADKHLSMARKEVNKSLFPNDNAPKAQPTAAEKFQVKAEPVKQAQAQPVASPKKSGSFFDEID